MDNSHISILVNLLFKRLVLINKDGSEIEYNSTQPELLEDNGFNSFRVDLHDDIIFECDKLSRTILIDCEDSSVREEFEDCPFFWLYKFNEDIKICGLDPNQIILGEASEEAKLDWQKELIEQHRLPKTNLILCR